MEENINNTTQQASDNNQGVVQNKKWRKLFMLFAVSLLGVFIFGLYWIFTQSTASPIGTGWFVFSFAAGLSMIVLPCTLPLAFVIVPLSMGKGYVKGLAIALAFGLGVTITLSMYGILAALLGKAVFSFSDAGGEIIKNIFYAIAGLFSMLFALGELGFIRAKMPSYMGAAPGFIQRRKDVAKAFMLGLFLGNIGIGCPHPATPMILGQIGVVGDVFFGWLLFFVHAIGRVLPLLLLAILGILGVNATKALLKHKDSIARATAWGMVVVGAFLFTLGFFSHDWWVASGQHTLFETVVQEARFTGLLRDRLGSTVEHIHGIPEGGTGMFGVPLWLGNWVFVILMLIPMWWYYFRKKKEFCIAVACRNFKQESPSILGVHILSTCVYDDEKLADETIKIEKKVMPWRFWALFSLSALLAVVFIYALPTWFVSRAGASNHNETAQIVEHEEHAGDDAHGHDAGEAMVDEHVGHALPDVNELIKLPLRTPADRIENLPFIITEDGVKEFRLEAGEFRWEYAPGKWIHVWGYNGQIPGPAIRVVEGDKVRVIVQNNLPDATTVHWHGVDVPWKADGVPGVTQDPIEPGEQFIYEFTAKPSGTKWYHTHGNSAITTAQQLDMGLSGSFIIEPKKLTYTYDKEYTLVLDEWDVAGDGINPAVAHVHGAGADNAVPSYNTFTINGRIHPYTSPLKIKQGERVLIRFINVGTTAFHPMHLHGHNFTVVAKDGNLVPEAALQERNVFTLHPGETADVLVVANNPGKWLLHCHHVHHASAGMITLFEYE